VRWSREIFTTNPAGVALVGERVGLDGAVFAKASRLVAKVDSAAVQDGFQLYLHSFIVTDDANGLSSSKA
jgi:uncharacterized protein